MSAVGLGQTKGSYREMMNRKAAAQYHWKQRRKLSDKELSTVSDVAELKQRVDWEETEVLGSL